MAALVKSLQMPQIQNMIADNHDDAETMIINIYRSIADAVAAATAEVDNRHHSDKWFFRTMKHWWKP